jgi:hypothetical protein
MSAEYSDLVKRLKGLTEQAEIEETQRQAESKDADAELQRVRSDIIRPAIIEASKILQALGRNVTREGHGTPYVNGITVDTIDKRGTAANIIFCVDKNSEGASVSAVNKGDRLKNSGRYLLLRNKQLVPASSLTVEEVVQAILLEYEKTLQEGAG